MIRFTSGSLFKVISLCKSGRRYSDEKIAEMLFPNVEYTTNYIGHVKDCTKNLPDEITQYMSDTDQEEIIDTLNRAVRKVFLTVISSEKQPILIAAIQKILEEDLSIADSTQVGYLPSYTKGNMKNATIFLDMEESEVSMILDNNDFAYWNVTVERPLRLRVFPERTIPANTFKKADEYETVTTAIAKASATAPLDDWKAFAKVTKLKKAQLNKVRPFITEKDATAVATDEPDTDLRDTENIPFTYEGGIEAFMQNEVLTYAPDAYIDEKKTQIGYEISFTKYFYKPVELREMSEIIESLNSLEKEADGMMADIMGGIR